MTDVIVVLDPTFGERLEPLSALAPVWIADTEINKKTYERLRHGHENLDHREKGAITSFKINDKGNRVKSLLDIIPDVETHHGRVEGDQLVFPGGFVIQVIGVALNTDVIHGLGGYGFTSFVETADGFHATKDENVSPVSG